MKKFVSFLIFFCLFFSVFTVFLPTQNCSAADTLHVGSGQTYATIQDAINAANESDTIYVHSGTYNEHVDIDKSITLTGEGSSSTTVVGSTYNTINVTVNDVTISGLKIRNTGGDKACVFLTFVENCNINNNIMSQGGNLVYLSYSNGNTIEDNKIEDANVAGIYLSSSDNNEIKNNEIKGSNGNGIFLNSGANSNTIYLNDFSDNSPNNARDLGSNTWSYNSQGNYWDDYNDYDKDPEDGIGDSPYSIEGGSYDNYPLGDFLDDEPQAFIDSISPDPATEGDSVSFNGHSTDDGTILEWEWRSSINGQFGSSEDVTYSGLSTGTHTIRFRVKDDNNQWSDYAQETLVVNSGGGGTGATQPTASITKPSSTITEVEGNSIEFRGYGVPSDGMILEYKWTSNLDGDISSISSFTKDDLSVGTHSISFKVRDSNGWSDTDTVGVTIQEGANTQENTPPNVETGGPYTGKVGTPIVFDGSGCSDDDEDEITSYQWSFGDGEIGTGITPSHTYSESGTYTVVLTISDGTDTNTDTTEAVISSENDDNNDDGNNQGDGDGDNDNNDDGVNDGENNNNDNQDDTNEEDNDEESPGFLIIFILIAIVIIAIVKKKYS